jgi:hypothetical protein
LLKVSYSTIGIVGEKVKIKANVAVVQGESKKNSSLTVFAITSILKLLIVIKTSRAQYPDYELKNEC